MVAVGLMVVVRRAGEWVGEEVGEAEWEKWERVEKEGRGGGGR
jgi:hypothetical protein